jgi:signal transduction histidine kinase
MSSSPTSLIINYSRNSRLPVNYEKIDFSALIHQCLEQLNYLPERSKIEVQIRVNEQAPFYSDRNRIQTLLNNLLSNAIKYHNASQKHPWVHIQVYTDADRAELEIKDNGAGISRKHLDKIFLMFYRATTEKSGSGLGLYITKEIVDKMSGGIEVKTEEGIGTSFYVNLPNKNSSKELASGTGLNIEHYYE